MYGHLLFMTGFWKSFKPNKTPVPMNKRSKVLGWKGKVAGLIPSGAIYFYFELFACFCSSQLEVAHANEIKHDNSPVVYVVLYPSYDLSYKAYACILPQYTLSIKIMTRIYHAPC